MTNGDRIRQMSNEELAEWLDDKMKVYSCNVCLYDYRQRRCNNACVEGIKAYLESEEK